MSYLTAQRTTRYVCVVVLVLLATLLLSLQVGAQDLDEVTFEGIVFDQNGAAIPGAVVTAVLFTRGSQRSVVTNDEGQFHIVELPPGTYALRVSSPGFATEERVPLVLVAGRKVSVQFVLKPAEVAADSVVISDAAVPLVDSTRTVSGSTITHQEIESLPAVSRSPLDLVLLLANVTEEPLSVRDQAEDRSSSNSGSIDRAASTPEEAGNFALAGGSAFSNNITIDGMDNNDDRAARERLAPPIGAVEEVQVVTNQFSAEYGRASGGRVNLRTRGGSNNFVGQVKQFFRDEALDANTRNNSLRGLKRLPLQEHIVASVFSGPISRTYNEELETYAARSHFFTAFEFGTILDSALIDTLVPLEQNPRYPLPSPTTLASRRHELEASPPNLPAELAPYTASITTPLTNRTTIARVDHRYTEMHNGTFTLQLGRYRNLRQFGGGLRLADSLLGRRRDSETLSYSDNLVFTPSFVNQFRLQLSRLRPSIRAQVADRPVVLIAIKDPLVPGESIDRSGTLVAGSSSSGATDRREKRFQLQETLTILSGAHVLKVGTDLQGIASKFIDLGDASGTYNFASAASFLANTPSRFRQRFNTESTQENRYTGIFLHDEWRLRANFLLSLGLRWENETIVRDRNNFGPRAAIAYDPTGAGRSVVRIGAGIFFNRALLRTVDDFALGRQVVEFDTNQLPSTERLAFIATNLRFPEVLDPNSDLVRAHGERIVDFARRIDPGIRIPESYQLHAGFERQFGGAFVVEASYTFNRGIHLWREVSSNAPRLPAGYQDWSEYLLARDFPNVRDALSGARPLYNASTAGEIVRFTVADASSAEGIDRVVEFGVPVSVFYLNNVSSSTTIAAALAALQSFRPERERGQVELLVAAGNSFYHALGINARGRLPLNADGSGIFFRAAYTLSNLIDDGVVNTSSALRPGDFFNERSRSLIDRRHRFVLSSVIDLPRWIGSLRVSSILRLASGAPFNISIGGADRNLDDVSNDRPNFHGDPRVLRYRQPGAPPAVVLVESFTLPLIGQNGNLPRNAGRGPSTFILDATFAREFRFGDRVRIRPVMEIGNVLNKTVFTFGAEFINFSQLRPNATAEQRRAFYESFLVPTKTLRPRNVRLGLRLDF